MTASGVFDNKGRLLAAVSGLVVISFLLAPPLTVLGKTHAVGYAICHQLPGHTFHFGGVPLPLCARCTGIYLGFLSGLTGMVLLRRQYAIDLPPTPILAVLVMFITAMVFDGLNSLLDFLPDLSSLYPPQNWLRLTTGTLHGVAIGVIAYPVVSISIWQPELTENVAIVENSREFAALLAAGGAIILLVMWQNPVLLYPLAVLSTLGVLLMLTLLNTVVVLVVTRREAMARSWRDVLVPALMALAVSFLLIGGVDWLRAAVSSAANLPF